MTSNTPDTDKPAREFLTVQEVAERLPLSVSFLNKARGPRGPRGPRFVKLGTRVFYRLADLEAWVAENTFSTTAEAAAI